MRRNGTMIAASLLVGAFALLAMAGCSSASAPSTSSASANTPTFSSPGEQIYATGADQTGLDIGRTSPVAPAGAPVMSEGGCARCHGPNGSGGSVLAANGTYVEAPNVTYASLIKSGFKDATIIAAITKGTDEVGKPLDQAMPRWQMTPADANATLAYLKTLK